MCLGPGSNWGPIPLQGSALPTELPRHDYIKLSLFYSIVMSLELPRQHT